MSNGKHSTYEANIPVTRGENTITVEAEDFSPHKNTAVKRWKFNAVTTAPRSFTYDANGNLLDDGRRAYTWDAANRLAGVTVRALGASPQVVYAFSYDGAGRRVAESVDGAPTRRWVWAPGAAQPSAELNAAGDAVAKRFYGQGEVRFDAAGAPNAEKFFYFRDHLGSVREVVNNDRQVVARLDYGDYGRRTRLPLTSAGSSPGTFEPAFGYTGHLSHPGTGLVLTRYRAYDPETARWISRDPIFESGGMNLYGYVGGAPLGATDPLGLEVYVNAHKVIFPSYHVSVAIFPANQGKWAGADNFSYDTGSKLWYTTLGAGPVGNYLNAGYRRERDNQSAIGARDHYQQKVAMPSCYKNEDAWIGNLLGSQDAFIGNSAKAPIWYSFFPAVSPGYNSNSYISGLLQSSGVRQADIDVFPFSTPGLSDPVNSSYFSAK